MEDLKEDTNKEGKNTEQENENKEKKKGSDGSLCSGDYPIWMFLIYMYY